MDAEVQGPATHLHKNDVSPESYLPALIEDGREQVAPEAAVELDEVALAEVEVPDGTVLEAASHDLAVLIPTHTRKGGGEDGDAVRGSSAFAGTADVILELERPQGAGHARQRVLAALGRFSQTPGALLIDQDAGTDTWRVVGEGVDRHDARAICDREALLEHLPTGEPGLTRDELEAEVDSPHRQWAPQIQKPSTRVCRAGRSGPERRPVPLSAPCAETVRFEDVDHARLDELATRHPEAA